MRKDLTELVFILDRSGSMSGLEADTIGGFNALIEKQRKQEQQPSRVRSFLTGDTFKALLPLMETEDAPFLSQSADVWQNTIDWMYDEGMIERKPEIDEVMDYMEQHPFYDELEGFFQLLYSLKNKPVPEKYFAFPGPFIRDILHYMDRCALSRPTLSKH